MRLSAHLAAALLAVLLLAAGCDPKKAPDQAEAPREVKPLEISGEAAYKLVEAQVKIGPRRSGSPAAAKTAEWIADQVRAAGWEPQIDKWTEQTANGEVTFRNVLVTVPGKLDGFVVVGSHYDTKYLAGTPYFVGANDGASSTAVLLEMLRAIKAGGPWAGRELRFAFFDGEEAVNHYGDRDGLHGSRHYAGKLAKAGEVKACKAMVLLDMVGDPDLKLTLSSDDSPRLLQLLLKVADERGERDHVGFYNKGTVYDDHVPFKKIGIPAIDLIDFDYGPGNAWWHNADDNLEHVSPASLELIGGLSLHLLQLL